MFAPEAWKYACKSQEVRFKLGGGEGKGGFVANLAVQASFRCVSSCLNLRDIITCLVIVGNMHVPSSSRQLRLVKCRLWMKL